MSDIVERLRERAASGVNCLCGNPVCDEAAEEILRLRALVLQLDDYNKALSAEYRAENEKLRAALKAVCQGVISERESIDCAVIEGAALRAAAAAIRETENG